LECNNILIQLFNKKGKGKDASKEPKAIDTPAGQPSTKGSSLNLHKNNLKPSAKNMPSKKIII
jgi:hypothetical protein